jgi:hypothetical protein
MKHLSFILTLLLLGCSANLQVSSPGRDASLSPEQVVTLFHETYGSARMDEIGPYTTERFRQNLPVTVWLVEVWKQLKDLRYEKLDFEIVESKVETTHASVVTRAKIKTKVGESDQQEIYMLILEDGVWKIDEMFVTDEEVRGEDQEL